MTREEKILNQLDSQKNPFLVPEGYFQELPNRIIDRIHNIPVQQKKKRNSAVRWIIAAVMTAVVCSAGFALYDNGEQDDLLTQQIDSEYIEDALDYTMINNHDIENYLTEAY